jgi:hypothetical protein
MVKKNGFFPNYVPVVFSKSSQIHLLTWHMRRRGAPSPSRQQLWLPPAQKRCAGTKGHATRVVVAFQAPPASAPLSPIHRIAATACSFASAVSRVWTDEMMMNMQKWFHSSLGYLSIYSRSRRENLAAASDSWPNRPTNTRDTHHALDATLSLPHLLLLPFYSCLVWPF